MGAFLADEFHRMVPVVQGLAFQEYPHGAYPGWPDAGIGQRNAEFRRIRGKMVADRQLHERPDCGGRLFAGGLGFSERRVQRDDRNKDADQRQDGLPECQANERPLAA
jgi:hypothetical protein